MSTGEDQVEAREDAAGRALSVAVVGGGFGGIGAAVLLRRAGWRDITVFEKRERLGGVWEHNTYPGAACDVPSHLYEFSFEPNPRWSRRFAPQAEIQAYIEDVAGRHGVLDSVRLGVEVLRAQWDEERQRWLLETSAGPAEADVLIPACGQLSVPKLPAIEGLGRFQGPIFHTARWRHDVELAGKRVAVIGTGCSAIQAVPEIAPIAEQVDVYQRSPGWTMPKMNFSYSERAKRLFERFPIVQRLDRMATFAFMDLGAAAMTGQRWLLKPFRAAGRHQIETAITDPELRARVTPADEVGCKRIMLTDEWYPTLNRPDVELVTAPIAGLTEHGVMLADGNERPADAIILATGFDSHAFVAPMEVLGKGGRTLAEEWTPAAHAYLGLSVPDFPNMFLIYGPNTNGGTGSVIYVIEAAVAHYRGHAGDERQRRARDRGAARDRAGLQPRTAPEARGNCLAHRMRELVPGRERQRPEPMAVAVEHLPASHRADRAGHVPARQAGGRAARPGLRNRNRPRRGAGVSVQLPNRSR